MPFRDTSEIDDLYGVLQNYDLAEIYENMKGENLTLEILVCASKEELQFGAYIFFLWDFCLILIFWNVIETKCKQKYIKKMHDEMSEI